MTSLHPSTAIDIESSIDRSALSGSGSGSGNGGLSLTRSPHPYHRRSASVVGKDISPKAHDESANSPAVFPHASSSSSDSGTEADDERGHLLKGLPAPPLRSHKGLRGASPFILTPTISPLPTPPVDERERGKSFFERANGTVVPQRAEVGGIQQAREAYARRMRAGLVRRMTEICILLGIGGVVFGGPVKPAITQWRREIHGFAVSILGLYSLYPLRLTTRSLRVGIPLRQSLKRGFHIPSRFDPGTLLYPVLLPSYVAATLIPRTSALLLPNLILGLSSIPFQVISLSIQPSDTNPFQWVISITPVIACRVFGSAPYALKVGDRSGMSAENLVMLCPLQKALVPVLDYLTTTSLDRSELELLSTTLVNLLIFGTTPQMEILKALLWLGGFALFGTCAQIMTWEVALARIPNWKLSRRRRGPGSLLSLIDSRVCKLLASARNVYTRHDSSDDEILEGIQRCRSGRKPALNIKTHSDDGAIAQVQWESQSATEPCQIGSANFPPVNASHKIVKEQRRYTLSSLDESRSRQPRTTGSGRTKRLLSPRASSFLSLSPEQAQVRKWLYAGLVYTLTLGIILIPIRRYVSLHALSFNEPFGWALGYLLGNIHQVRFFVVSNNLEKWIKLPPRPEEVVEYSDAGWLEQWRQATAGPATTRLFICAYCCAVLMIGIAIVLRLSAVVEVDTRRKVFHGIMVAMLLPTIFVDPCFIALALVLILAIFLLLDLFRASQLPPISKPLTRFLAPYVDGRDHRGPVIVSHMFLLIGCAIPLWLSLAGVQRTGDDPWAGWDVKDREVSMLSGVVCVGMGDAAASLIGRRYGKTKWYWGGGKSLEGSLAFAGAVTVGLMASYIWLRVGGWVKWDEMHVMLTLGKCFAAGSGASLLETTLTAANDNVVVPVGLWLLVSGLQI